MVIADLGANVTLPCRLHNKDFNSFSHVGIRVKWTKVAEDESLNEDVLLSMGFHKKSFGSFEDRVFLQEHDSEDASLVITSVSMDDMGQYRCEIINGMEDTIQEIILEVQGGLNNGKSSLYNYLKIMDEMNCVEKDTLGSSCDDTSVYSLQCSG